MTQSNSEHGRVIRWGIVGTGAVARDFARDLAHVEGAQLAAVASRDAARASDFAAALGAGHGFGSYAEMLASGQCDVIYIATPPDRHRDDALAAIEAGLPVLCEKPFTLDAAQAQEVIEAARGRGLFCMEAMWMRFIPAMRRALEIVDSGAIGEAKILAADFAVPALAGPGSRIFDPARGGGALLDYGVYLLSLAQSIFGEPADVRASASLHADGADEHIAITLAYPHGRMAQLTASLACYGTNEAVVMGSTGRLVIHEPLCRPDRLTVRPIEPRTTGGQAALHQSRGERLKESIRHNALLRRVRTALGRGTQHIAYRGNGYNYEAREVVRCLREGLTESPVMPLDETLAVMRTADAVRRAAGIGR